MFKIWVVVQTSWCVFYPCVYICFGVFECVRVHVRMRVCVSVHVSVSVRVCVCVSVHAQFHVQVCFTPIQKYLNSGEFYEQKIIKQSESSIQLLNV